MRPASILLCLLMLCAFKGTTYETVFVGYLRSKSQSRVDHLHVLIKERKKIVASAETDKNGHYEVSFNANSGDKAPLLLYYVSRKGDTVLLKKFVRLDDQITKVNFRIP